MTVTLSIDDGALSALLAAELAKVAVKHEEPKADAMMSPAETAKYLGIAKPTMARWLRDRVIPCTKVGGRVLISRADVDTLLADGKVGRYTRQAKN